MDPRVTFIVPCYNYGRFVAQAIDSILNQSFRDIEVIVIDDASTDDSAEVLKRYRSDSRVHVIQHGTNQRHIRSYNEGLALAQGDFVAILSADDYCLSSTVVERAVAVFDRNPRVGMIYAAYAVVEDEVIATHIIPSPEDRVRPGVDEFRSLMWGNYVLHSGTFLRREVQAELGPYDATLPQSGDWDMWLRTAARHDVGYIAEPMYAYRMHHSNMQSKGIPPRQQADQNVRTLERGFAALPPGAPADILGARGAALRHALLQTAYFDLFNGRRMRAWQGVAYAVRQRPEMLLGAELRRILPRLLLLTIAGRDRYRGTVEALQKLRRHGAFAL